MYDLTHGHVFTGVPTHRVFIARSASPKATPSRSKGAAILLGLILGATTAAGAVTIRHKAPTAGFTSHFSSSSGKVLGSAGFEVALY